MNKAHKVLVTVAEAHTTAYTTLEEACATREVESNHTLVLVPDVNHTVELVVARAYIIYIKQGIPVSVEFGKCLVNLLSSIELSNQGVSLILIDHLRCSKLLVLLILNVTQQEYKVLTLAWLECYLDIVRSNGAPTMGVAVAGLALHHYLRIGKLVVKTYKGLTVCIESLNLSVYVIESVVVAALAILRLVINGATLYLYLSC